MLSCRLSTQIEKQQNVALLCMVLRIDWGRPSWHQNELMETLEAGLGADGVNAYGWLDEQPKSLRSQPGEGNRALLNPI